MVRMKIGRVCVIAALALAACSDELGQLDELDQLRDEALPPETPALELVAPAELSAFASGSPGQGYVCFDLRRSCTAPDYLYIERDGAKVWDWGSFFHESAVLDVPGTACIDTDDAPVGSYSFVLTESCAGVERQSLDFVVATTHAPIQVNTIRPNKVFYSMGDQVVVDFETSNADAILQVDLSALDSTYSSGSETVTTPSPGDFRLAYTLSMNNQRPSGDHELGYRFLDVDGRLLTSGTLSVRYLPNGPMRTHVAAGSYDPRPVPTMPVGAGLSLDAVVDTGVDRDASGYDASELDFTTTPVVPDAHSGRVVRLDIRTQGPDAVERLSVDVWEPGRDGYVRVPLALSTPACTATECTYQSEVVIRAKAAATAAVGPATKFRLVSGAIGSPASDWQAPDIEPAPPTAHVVRGTISYPHRKMHADCTNQSYPKYPMWCDVKAPSTVGPVRRMSIRVADSCNMEVNGWTDDEGQFEIPFETVCPNQAVRVSVSSFHEPAPYPIAVARRRTPPQPFDSFIAMLDALTANPNDYFVPREVVATFVPAQDAAMPAGLTLDLQLSGDEDAQPDARGIRESVAIAQVMRRSLDYYGQWLDPFELDYFNMLYDAEEEIDGANYSIHLLAVHPAFIHIHPRSAWSEFTIAHESAHYFHMKFLRGYIMPWTQNGRLVTAYGRFSEPMCHVQAAAINDDRWMIAFLHNNAEDLDYNGNFERSDSVRPTAPEMTFYPDLASAPPPTGSCNEPQFSEARKKDCMMGNRMGFIWRLFFDLHDGSSAQSPEPEETFYVDPDDPLTGFTELNFDQFDGRHGVPSQYALMDALLGYLGRSPCNPGYEDRGQIQLDLVDVLDGLACRGHMSLSNADILLTVMDLDYDFQASSSCGSLAEVCP